MRGPGDFQEALEAAPTVLESFFWGWLCGVPNCEHLYFEELAITDLRGPGHMTNDFVGEM